MVAGHHDDADSRARAGGERGLRFRLEVDGGIDLETGLQCRQAGADAFVAGTSFFAAEDRDAFDPTVAAW